LDAARKEAAMTEIGDAKKLHDDNKAAKE